jgi:plastocyanin
MRQTLGRRLLVALCVLVAAGGLACGDDAGGGDDGGGAGLSSGGSGEDARGEGGRGHDELEDVVVVTGPEATVEARDNTFDAENIQVAPGTRVVWTNNGRQDHDIVPAEGNGWGVAPEHFAPDAVYEHTFDEPGTYRYYCSLHGTAEAGMTGAVVVEE